jgi:hypothetical protein
MSVPQEIDPGFFQCRNNPAQRFSTSANRPIEIFHPPNRAERHLGFLRKFPLRPAKEPARRPYMPAIYDDQKTTLARLLNEGQETEHLR